MFLAAAVVSCTKDDECDPGTLPVNDNAITIDPVIAQVTTTARTAITGSTATWKNGDSIGVFCAQAMPSAAVNIPFTVADTSTHVWTNPTPIYWKDGTTSHLFTAYAPYAAGNTSATAVKLPSLGTQNGTIAPAMDFLISKNLYNPGVTRSANPVGLVFTHAFALIQLQITVNASLAAGTTLTSVVLTAGASDTLVTTDGSATINLTNGAITAANIANTATVTPGTPPALSSTATNIYVLILPKTVTTTPTLKINLSEGGTAISPATVPLGTTQFAAGSKYTYTVAISRTAITISNPTITDWTTVNGSALNPGI